MEITPLRRDAFISQHDMIWEQGPQRWLDGIPLGNGHIGAVLWGDGRPLNVALDKYDCWELRERPTDKHRYNYETLRRLVEAGQADDIERIFRPAATSSDQPCPTRLPMPRLEIDFRVDPAQFTARLALCEATVSGEMPLASGAMSWRAYVHAARNLLVIECHNLPEEFSPSVEVGLDHLSKDAQHTLSAWGYPAPEFTQNGDVSLLRQTFPTGGEYVVAWHEETTACSWRLLLTIVTHNDAAEPLTAATNLLTAAHTRPPEALYDEHTSWWQEFWQASLLHIPDTRLEALYYAEMYKLGSSARPEGLPISLQGVWTIDGEMPPWSGDHHLDMNVQESYWPIYTANHLDLGHSLYEAFYKALPVFERRCEEFFGWEGAWSGCSMAYNGSPVPGYPTTEFWPGNGAWLCHMYWLHWLYSRDEEFLRNRAYPMMRAFMQTYLNLLEEGPDGKLHLPLSNSPEWEEGNHAAWGSDSTCDLALIRWLAQALVEAAELLNIDSGEATQYRRVQESLADYPQDEAGLLIQANTPLTHSHRHHSYLMAIHPLGVLTVDDGPAARALIRRSIAHWQRQGTGQWTGWAFPWASLIASRCGLGNMAWQMLDIYANAFIAPNTFHINGDPRQFGLASHRYEPMTLEAGFCAAAAIMEMLLQSWAGNIRLFPALPDRWHNAYFNDLRAEGAFLVTSRLQAGEVVFVEVFSEQGGLCRIANPWPEERAVLTDLADNSTIILAGPQLRFATHPDERCRLHPEGRPPTAQDLTPPLPEYDEGQKHFFGRKSLARF